MYKHVELEGTIYYPVASHLTKNLSTIKEMAKLLRKEFPDKVLILWARGSSGAIIASSIMSFLRGKNCYMNYVRKESENTHECGGSHTQDINGVNIIVDDFVSTGTTIETICKEVNASTSNEVNCICVSGYIDEKKIITWSPYLSISSTIICGNISLY